MLDMRSVARDGRVTFDDEPLALQDKRLEVRNVTCLPRERGGVLVQQMVEPQHLARIGLGALELTVIGIGEQRNARACGLG